jgi:hypothetical protein
VTGAAKSRKSKPLKTPEMQLSRVKLIAEPERYAIGAFVSGLQVVKLETVGNRVLVHYAGGSWDEFNRAAVILSYRPQN